MHYIWRMELAHIVPALPPALSGVGDFAVRLAGELSVRHQVGSRFIVGDPAWNGAPLPAQAVTARSARALRKCLDATSGAVLLHYVGYGYAHRGCPFWLVDALEGWKRETRRRLIVLFHEVFAPGPIWSSAFWVSPFQRRLAARLARLADARRITTAISLAELQGALRRGEDLPTVVAPVFSTLGEPAEVTPPAQRERQAVVFGSPPVRAEVYASADALRTFCRQHGIERVFDVGRPFPGGARLDGVEVREMGPMAAPEASALFSRSLAGYFNYPASRLAKSTIFAAYCAHGLVPVTFPGNIDARDGLRAGEHFLTDANGSGFEAVAAAARAWYQGHRLESHARDIYGLMLEPPGVHHTT